MEKRHFLIGYQINEFYFYSIENRTLFKLREKMSKVVFRRTMASLFEYLLNNSQGRVVCDNEIMTNVWEVNSLKSSSQRLWQVMGNLKRALNSFGLEEDLIIRANSCGYIVKYNAVCELYIKKAV